MKIQETRQKKRRFYGCWTKTRTSMGARCLRRWLEQPLRDSATINKRLESVKEFVGNTKMRNNLYDILGDIRDIERLTSKIAYGSPTPKDLFALGSSLRSLPPIKNMLEYAQSPMLKEIKRKYFHVG